MSKSNDWETKCLQFAYGDAPSGFTRTSATLYVALHTGDPGETGASNECSGSGYARKQYDAGSTNWTVSGNSATNANAIAFAALSGSLTGVSHWSTWTASSGGECRHKGSFTTSRDFASGDTPTISASNLTVTED